MTSNFLTVKEQKTIRLTAQSDAEKVIFHDLQKNGCTVKAVSSQVIEITESKAATPETVTVKKLLLFEALNNPDGKGGNDGVLGGTAAGNRPVTDGIFNSKGWEFAWVYGGFNCIKLGNTTAAGYLATPPINADSKRVRLQFRAIGWTGDKGTVLISAQNARLTSGCLIQTCDQWTEYSAEFAADKNARITLQSETNGNRVFIDSIRIYEIEE